MCNSPMVSLQHKYTQNDENFTFEAGLWQGQGLWQGARARARVRTRARARAV